MRRSYLYVGLEQNKKNSVKETIGLQLWYCEIPLKILESKCQMNQEFVYD